MTLDFNHIEMVIERIFLKIDLPEIFYESHVIQFF